MGVKTPEQLSKSISDSIPDIEKALQGMEVLVINDVEGAITQRIFNKGEGVNGKIGKYKEGSYKKRREREGRQTGYVDLEFTGELRRSIVKGTKNDNLALGFVDEEKGEIAGHLETKYKTIIFAPSEEEKKEAIKTAEAYMVKQLQEIVKRW